MKLDEASKRIWLLDYDTVHYGLWPLDFVRVWRDAAKNDAAVMRRALKIYLAKRPDADIEYFKKAFPYMLLFYSLCKCGVAIRKINRLKNDLEDYEFQKLKALQHWDWINQILQDPTRIIPDCLG